MAHHSTGPHTDFAGRHCGADHVDAKSHHGGRTGPGGNDPRIFGHHSSRCAVSAPAHRLRLRCGRSTHAVDRWRHVYSGSGWCARGTGHDTYPKSVLARPLRLGVGILCHWRRDRCYRHVPAGATRQASGTGAKTGSCGTGVVHDDHRLRGHRRRGRTLSGSLLPRALDGGHQHRIGSRDHGDADRHPRH